MREMSDYLGRCLDVGLMLLVLLKKTMYAIEVRVLGNIEVLHVQS